MRRRVWRRRGMMRAIRRGWTPGGRLIILSLAVAIGTTLLLDEHGGDAEIDDLIEYIVDAGREPIDLIVAAAERHRVVFLGDVPASAQPKRLAADAVEALTRGPGLDAVALEVGADLQPQIDRYLRSDPEDLSILFQHPRTLRAHAGTPHDYLRIYRRVWTLNQSLEPGRRIRIIAADLPGWPPERRLSPPVMARRYAQRDAYMADRIDDELLHRSPAARLLIFMDGYHGLANGSAALHHGGGAAAPVQWLVERLRQRSDTRVYTVLVDAAPRVRSVGTITSFGNTRAFDLVRSRLPDTEPFAVELTARFDFLSQPIRSTSGPGIRLRLTPDSYRLRDVADAYIYLGTPRGIEVVR